MSHPTVEQTIMFAATLHHGQIDKSGMDYFNHPLRVMLRLGNAATDAERHAALLHDTMENCCITADILRDFGYSEEVITMVELLSRQKDRMTYREFIERIEKSGNVGALKIKLADLYDNCSLVRRERLEAVERAKVEARMDQYYIPAIAGIRAILREVAETVNEEEMEVEIRTKPHERKTHLGRQDQVRIA